MASSVQTARDRQHFKNFLIVGKTGSGLSAFGNTLVNKANGTFKRSSDVQSVSHNVESDYGYHQGEGQALWIRAVVAPGVFNTRINEKRGLARMFQKFEEVFELQEHYEAIILVRKYGDRFLNEDVETVEFLKKTLGPDFLKTHKCVVALTHGDNFVTEESESGMSFEEWCRGQQGYFSELIQTCAVILFDNVTKDETKRVAQIDKLLKAVAKLPGRKYTSDDYIAAQKYRDVLILESKKAEITEEAINRSLEVTNKLKEIDENQNEDAIVYLQQLQAEESEYHQKIAKEDNGTDVLKYAIQVMTISLSTIKSSIAYREKIARERKATDEQRVIKDHIEALQAKIGELEEKIDGDRGHREQDRQRAERVAEERIERLTREMDTLRQAVEVGTLKQDMRARNADARRRQKVEQQRREEMRKNERREEAFNRRAAFESRLRDEQDAALRQMGDLLRMQAANNSNRVDRMVAMFREIFQQHEAARHQREIELRMHLQRMWTEEMLPNGRE